MRSPRLSSFSLVLVALAAEATNSSSTCGTLDETAMRALITSSEHRANNSLVGFPPEGDDTGQVAVYIAVLNPRFGAIDPAQNRFQLTFSTDTYWPIDQCSGSVGTYGCAARIGTWYFVWAPGIAPGSITRTHASVNMDAYAGKGALASSHLDPSCVSADFTVTTVSFYQTFDMSHYPFEVHELRFELVSFFSTDFVALKLTQSIASGATVQPPWTLRGDVECEVVEDTSDSFEARGSAALNYSKLSCAATVGKINYDWFSKDFIMFVLLVGANLFSSISLPATVPIPDGLHSALTGRAVTSFALLTTFSLTLSDSSMPYGVSYAQFDGRLSICYCVYTIGLGLFGLCAFYSAFIGFLSLGMTRDRTVQPTALSAFTRNKMDAKAQVVHPETTGDGKPAGAHLVEADFFHDRLAFYDFVVNLAIHLLALVAALGLVIDGYVFYVEGG